MKRIQIFVEGGGRDPDQKTQLRGGFSRFFSKAGVSCHVVACGGRDAAFKKWHASCSSRSEAFNVLLVDSEGPVSTTPRRHLVKNDPSWQIPSGCDEQLHLMVQMMEAWFLADPEALATYYGQGFGKNALPGRLVVEEVPKVDIESALKSATEKTQKKRYHKIRHGADLLAKIDPVKVRKRAPHCERLLTMLANVGA